MDKSLRCELQDLVVNNIRTCHGTPWHWPACHQYNLSFSVARDIFMQFSPFTGMICAWFHRISTFPPGTNFYGNISTSSGIIWSVSSVSPLGVKFEMRVKSCCCHLERDKWHIVDDVVRSSEVAGSDLGEMKIRSGVRDDNVAIWHFGTLLILCCNERLFLPLFLFSEKDRFYINSTEEVHVTLLHCNALHCYNNNSMLLVK